MVGSPKILLGASIPRSGHHYLQSLLRQYFGDSLFYCEFYTVRNCCKTIPCTRGQGRAVVYQKNHDRNPEVPKGLADVVYLLQYRHPVPEALSDRELFLQDDLSRISLEYRLSREHYAMWLARKAVYYRQYHDKWFRDRVPNAIYLDYERLSRTPAEAIEEIARAATGSADRARAEAAVEAARATQVSAKGKRRKQPFKPRVIQDSPHFDADLLGAFEDYILTRAPGFGYQRMLEGRYDGHPLHGLIIAIDEEEELPPGQTDRLSAAIAIAGEHPELMLRMAQREMRDGKPAAAAERLRRVVQRHPHCTAAWGPLFAAYEALDSSPPPSILDGTALLAMTARPDLLQEAGRALLEAGHAVNAFGALAIAETLEPGKAATQHLLAAALVKMKRFEQALPYAEAAARGAPDNAAAARLLASLQRRLAIRRARAA